MSDRIILIRVLGLGSLFTDAQLVFTSRGTLPYLNVNGATLQGVVSNLGDQFSSEIGFFESIIENYRLVTKKIIFILLL